MAKKPTIADLLKRIENLEETVSKLTAPSPPPPTHHDAMAHTKRSVVMTEAQSHRSDDARKKSTGPKETRFTRNSITKARP